MKILATHIVVLGISHKTAPLEIREKFHLNSVERELLLSELKNDPAVCEAIILSTCNRTEIYANLLENNSQVLLRALASVKKYMISQDEGNYFYSFEGREAVRHFLSVSAGLDSLILGEKQILGQLKE